MFDIQSFFDAYGIAYRTGEGGRGPELKTSCPVCGGNQKLWCSLLQDRSYCHRCGWSPSSTENFVSMMVKANPFQVDLICRKFRKRSTGPSLGEIVDEITGNPSLDVSVASFGENGDQYQTVLKGFSVEQEEKPPLEWPPYYLPLGDPRIQTVTNYAMTRGFSFKLLARHHVGGCSLGKFYGTIILPAINGGVLSFWQARDVLGRNYDEFPKYRTPPGYSSRECLFNLDEAVEHDVVVICEGVFSAMRTGKDAVAAFGNKVSSEQVQLLVSRGVEKVVLCFDPDTWSLPKAMLDRGLTNFRPPIVPAVEMLLANFKEVRVVRLVDGDPDDMGTSVMREMIDSAPVVGSRVELAKLMGE